MRIRDKEVKALPLVNYMNLGEALALNLGEALALIYITVLFLGGIKVLYSDYFE